ncbi:Predicted metal-dependent hydrolase [Paraburkholderia xenovorans LB400]|uniref:6-methylsalicylate decarboxylase n=2 Tax=Paraburkholderia xenovorans TaxID=36873 RepID=Q140J6_PARXL|nr:Predicted metal-dependent hydrolase [Paraburkholderia xenovorans LB400]
MTGPCRRVRSDVSKTCHFQLPSLSGLPPTESMSHSRIDVHHHILPPQYVEAVGTDAIARQGSSGRVPQWSVDEALSLMDRSGIGTAITSITAPGVSALAEVEAGGLARWCNEFSANMVRDWPGRFGMFACLPLQSIDNALREAVYSLETLKADGVCLLSNYDGRYLGDPVMRPLYEELNRRKAVVFVHPTSPASMVPIDQLSPSSLEFPFDTTRTVASLIFGGITTDYPEIRWILSHAGGAMPYLAGRIELLTRNNPALRERIPDGFRRAMATFFFDCALSVDPAQFAALRELVPDSQLLFGTDYPFGPKGQIAETVSGVLDVGLEPGTLKALESDNALSLFPRLRDFQETATEVD